MKKLKRAFQTGLLMVCGAAAHAQMQIDTALAVFMDDEDGSSIDADVSVAPNKTWTFSLGAGTSDASSSDSSGLSGDALRAAADLHNERFGARAYFERWSASGSFETDIFGARFYYNAPSGLVLTLIAEDKSHELQLDEPNGLPDQVGNPSQVDAVGYGAGVSWYGSTWGAYVEGVFYSFDGALAVLRATTAPPTDPGQGPPGQRGQPGLRLGQQKKITDLVNSIVTATQGALDSQLSAGIERTFDRVNVHVDWLTVEDALDGIKSNSYSGGVRYAFTQSLDGGITFGISDSEDTESIAFAGLTVAYRR